MTFNIDYENTQHRSDEIIYRDRAQRLFRFLREMSELKSKTTRTIDQYEDIIWLNDIPDNELCFNIAKRQDPSAEKWIEIKKPNLQPVPPIPEVIRPWINLADIKNLSCPDGIPTLKEQVLAKEIGTNLNGQDSIHQNLLDDSRQLRITPSSSFEHESPDGGFSSVSEYIQLSDRPDIKTAWEEYIDKKWIPWAERDRFLKPIQHYYTQLFTLYQQQQRMGETFEVILGLGYLTWKTPHAQIVKRHILTSKTNLSFDSRKGIISAGPSPEDTSISLEEDMLEADERIDADASKRIEIVLKEFGDSIWGSDGIHSILKSWINCIPNSYKYDTSITYQQRIEKDPAMSFAPAIILRKRTERNLARAFKEIENQLEQDKVSPPKGIFDIVKDPSTTVVNDQDSENVNANIVDNEIYFPLLANDQQLEIARRSLKQNGILVQGPPGTGKSHTIANLICHYLAAGKKILITSHTSRALSVLKDKIPKDVSALCVQVLSDDFRSKESLENSVQGIMNTYSNWDAKKEKDLIAELECKLSNQRKESQKCYNEIKAIREKEIYQYYSIFEVYSGTLQKIANKLFIEESKFGWLVDNIEEDSSCPLGDKDATELLELCRLFTPESEQELSLSYPNENVLPSPSQFKALVTDEAILKAELEKNTAASHHHLAASHHHLYDFIKGLSIDSLEYFKTALDIIVNIYNDFLADGSIWANEAVNDVMCGHCEQHIELEALTAKHLKSIGEKARDLADVSVSGFSDNDYHFAKESAQTLLSHLESGGTINGIGKFLLPGTIKKAISYCSSVFLNGKPCITLDVLISFIEWIDVQISLLALDNNWHTLYSANTSSLGVKKALYDHQYNLLRKVIEMFNQRKILFAELQRINITINNYQNMEDFINLVSMVNAAITENRLKFASKRIKEFEIYLDTEFMDQNHHEVVKNLSVFIHTRNYLEYTKSFLALQTLNSKKQILDKKNQLKTKLQTLAPRVTDELCKNSQDPVWDSRLQNLSLAWNWARANIWLDRLNNPLELQRLTNRFERLKESIKETIAQLAAKKAWWFCMNRLSEAARQHLNSWMLAMRAIGHGYGKNANRHRRDARAHLEECRSAIPAWVMPIYRVAETVQMSPDIFDIVIVDEASQSGPEALFLQYLAKTIIVVGDDKQIKPDYIGIKSEDVDLLRQKYISDLPHSDRMGTEHSFFDQAMIRYPNPIRLQEHFRCMPEIIQFSNNLCYKQSPLIPLKQYGSGRLSPVLKNIYIPEGYQKGRSSTATNPPEAEKIVEQIEKCCKDPAYAGKSMGVISLLGEMQAKLIGSKLIQTIGPEEMEKRKIHCGDAYAFQGDERDVMFLSLVCAPNEEGRGIYALTDANAERRFNVAASRAKEQMWLFHSATLNDLHNQNCYRYRLLSYFLNPNIEQTEIAGSKLSIEELRSSSLSAYRSMDPAPEPFDSWFEIDVFLKIVSLGYRVIPQVAVAGYRIDMVVEGFRGRIAVECDGDQWHGPDKYDSDMARQRQLERSGYPFWRFRGSAYYRNPEKSINELDAFLRMNEIEPKPSKGSYIVEESDVKDSAISDIKEEQNIKDGQQSDSDEVKPISSPPGQFDYSIYKGMTKLPEYVNWQPRNLLDPREAAIEDIGIGLLSIVEQEGPILCYRTYSIYAKSCGIHRISNELKHIFDAAIKRQIKDKNIIIDFENGKGNMDQSIVRDSNSSEVRLRCRGDRRLDEIPPSEIAELMNITCHDNKMLIYDKEKLFRIILGIYDLTRKTEKTIEILERAFERTGLMKSHI